MVGIVVWVLMAIVFQSGQPKMEVDLFASQKACEIAAGQLTDGLVSEHINQGSVTCVQQVIGEFA